MSPLALCRIRPFIVWVNVAFGLLSFMLMSLGLLSFVLLSVYLPGELSFIFSLGRFMNKLFLYCVHCFS